VQVDRGWRVSDGAGESPHGKVFHAVADEDLASRTEDFQSHLVSVTGSPRSRLHEHAFSILNSVQLSSEKMVQTC
jgi:hypothetical protein